MNVKEYFEERLELHEEKVAEIAKLLGELPKELGELEADTIYDLGYNWLVLSDSSHKDLGAKLATLSDQTPYFESRGTDMKVQFTDIGPFSWVDLRRPKEGCRAVRVRTLPRELTITVCGEVPDKYEYLGEVEE